MRRKAIGQGMSKPLGKPETTGTFDEALELAKDGAYVEGGSVFVHRKIDMVHLGGEDCPCRPLVVSPTTLRKNEDLLNEIESLDG